MTGFEDIKRLYTAYIDKAEQLERDRKVGEGLFGIGKKPADDPCHDRFAADLEAALKDFAESSPEPQAVREVLGYIYAMPSEHKQPLSLYWMLTAVHGATRELIPMLDPDGAAELKKQYAKLFRRWERLPVQQQVFSALTKAAKNSEK